MSKIAIVGGGACSLAAAYYLSKKGHSVSIFESASELGGLGSSYILEGYPTEKFVHHLFYSDKYFRDLVDELGLSKNLIYKKTRDGFFINNKIYPFSTPIDLLKFTPISLISRIRTGLMAVILKQSKNYSRFQSATAKSWIIKTAGLESYLKVWEPLLVSKFGKYSDKISMAWFWARIFSRTSKLGYFDGGYQLFFDRLSQEIITNSGKIYLNSPVTNIRSLPSKKIELTVHKKKIIFDSVVATIPPSVFVKVTPQLQKTSYGKKLALKEMISATTLNLLIKKSFMPYYWLNIADKKFPFLVIVEHTHLVPKEKYGKYSMLYIGNYLSHTDKRYTNSSKENLKLFLPYLKKINPQFTSSWIKEVNQFHGLYAQPIVDTNYYKTIPQVKTPVKNLYLSCMSQIYPFDRGTNYAIREGKKVAEIINRSQVRK